MFRKAGEATMIKQAGAKIIKEKNLRNTNLKIIRCNAVC
jgi:hypothetical protein